MSIPLPASLRRIRELLAIERFDVLHVQVPYSPMLGGRIVKAADSQTAVIGTFHVAPHSHIVDYANRALAKLVASSLSRFDTLVSVSPAAQALADKTFHIASEVLPNVFDYQRFHGARAWPQYADKTRTILFLGRLVPRKGCQLLLEAANHLLRQSSRLPEFRIVICGKGPLMADLQEYVKAHNLANVVEFTGFVSEADKPRYYASADITVFPSTGGESFGIVLLEGMASGHAAVLAGDNPGYHSVMTDQPDQLFDPHDARKLANKLTTYLIDTQRRHAAQVRGKEYATAFDTNVVGPKVVAIYQQALRKRRRP